MTRGADTTIEMAQSNLVTLVAGAVLASCLVAVASLEDAQGQDAATLAAIDGIAAQIAGADCSPHHPQTTLALTAALSQLPKSVTEVSLLPDRIFARTGDGASLSSVEFPALSLATPLSLMGRFELVLSFDFVMEQCQALAR